MAEALRAGRSAVATKQSVPVIKKTLGVFHLSRWRAFFSNKRNLKVTIAVLVVFGLLYLFKDMLVVAIVNGQPIYRWNVVERLENQAGRQVLDGLVVETLAKQAVAKEGVTVEQSEIDAEVAAVEERLTTQGMTLDQALQQQGMTREEWVANMRLQKAVEKIVAGSVAVSEVEIDTYITDNQAYLPAELTGDALREEVRQQLMSTKLSEAIQQWVQGLQAEAQIIYLKEYNLTLQ